MFTSTCSNILHECAFFRAVRLKTSKSTKPNNTCLNYYKFFNDYTDECKLPLLEMFTKEECSLCDEAKEILIPYSHLFAFKEIDITLTENKKWFEKYRYDIPVFHLNGEYLMRHRVHLGLLRRKLNEIYGLPSKQ
ncbi:glutaredoxin-like protein C5orf63 homolog [Xenia sp. Carnegie-2017]|uniref:glutaredoxin-like protein C5orf63 homolog n=1 Tax=Xenia sp. Carnegie-2017 TaxID=2897299 RepID=UPI001F03FB84|nr:glutaredoxin-like protein C5orf63 homolog [Xenia sp. Carnegie-2017]